MGKNEKKELTITASLNQGCDLCGLPVRNDAFSELFTDRRFHFCCAGCKMVFTMLMAASESADPATFKESDLYRQCLAAGVVPVSEADLADGIRVPTGRETDKNTRFQSGDSLTLDTTVLGMWCPACAWVIGTALTNVEGILSADCDFSTDHLRCRYNPVRTTPDQIRKQIEALGYQAADDDANQSGQTMRRDFVRLAICALLSANVMMLSWALYSGYFTTLTTRDVSYISWPVFMMATAVFIFGGGPIVRKAWTGLRHGAPGMEALIVLGAGSAYLYSLYNWWTGTLQLYFDTATMLLTLLLLGKLLESQAKARVRKDLEGFIALLPTKVHVPSDTFPQGRYVSVDQLHTGDLYLLYPDEVAPADGRIEKGDGLLDASAITGEARPVAVQAGDLVSSGSRLLAGSLQVRADAVGRDALLGQMVEVVTQSLTRKTVRESVTDRMLRLFVPMIVFLAAATGLIGFFSGLTADQALLRTVTVLVIACPCALGIAVPLARVAGISGAGRRGLLVRDAAAFDQAGLITDVVLDKTGTATYGKWVLEKIQTATALNEETLVALAAGLEATAEHPVAQALRDYARQHGIVPEKIDDLCSHDEGVSGTHDGRRLKIGSRRFATMLSDGTPALHKPTTSEPAVSMVALSIDGRVAGRFYFGDTIRPSLPILVKRLTAEGMRFTLLSGDDETATRAVAAASGISTAHARLLPQDKAAYIQQMQNQGACVAMIGDGINDAPALAQSDLALAVHSGTPLARQSASVTFMRGDPGQMIEWLDWSEQVVRNIRQNLWCALGYNLISIPVAMAGLLTPLVAVTAMLLSSLTVIGNTLRLVRSH